MITTFQNKELPSFNPKVLKKARKKYEHSIDDLAKYSKIAISSLRNFEEGNKEPTYNQLEKLAKLYAIDVGSFFSESIPKLQSVPTDFRDKKASKKSISPNLLGLISDSNNHAKKLSILFEYNKHSKNSLSEYETNNLSELISENYISSIRKRLKINLSNITKLNEEGKRSLSNFYIRHQIESCGVSISYEKFSLKKATGYLISSNAVPLIKVNTSKHKNSYEFTIAHELSHLLLNLPGISNDKKAKNKIELACNTFASKFFAPSYLVSEVCSANNSFNKNVQSLHKATMLSKLASAYRLLELNKATRGEFKDWYKAYEPTESSGGYNPDNYHGLDGHLFAKLNSAGMLAIAIVKKALDADTISTYEASEILNFRERYLSEVIRLIRQRRADIQDFLGEAVFEQVERNALEDV